MSRPYGDYPRWRTTLHQGINEYISIVRFDCFENLRAWEESELRRDWLAKLPPDTVDGEADIRRLEGLTRTRSIA